MIDSRENGATIRRRRQCRACQHRWTTYEMAGPARFVDDLAEAYRRLSRVMVVMAAQADAKEE